MTARILKAHQHAKTFRAIVARPDGEILYTAARVGWTKQARRECYDWCELRGFSFSMTPQDAA